LWLFLIVLFPLFIYSFNLVTVLSHFSCGFLLNYLHLSFVNIKTIIFLNKNNLYIS